MYQAPSDQAMTDLRLASGWSMWVLSLGLTALLGGLAWFGLDRIFDDLPFFGSYMVLRPSEMLVPILIFGAIPGGIVGGSTGLILWGDLGHALAWIGAHVFGWSSLILSFLLLMDYAQRGHDLHRGTTILIMWTIGSSITGFGQWIIMRKRMPYAWGWPLLTTIGIALAFMLEQMLFDIVVIGPM